MESRLTVPPAGSTSLSSRPSPRPGAGRSRRPSGRGTPPQAPSPQRDRPRPKKSLGQHFLTDRNILRRIVDAAGLSGVETVVEIGAGPGDLTAELASRAGRLFAVELDEGLCEWLRKRFAAVAKVVIVAQDALTLDPGSLVGFENEYVVVGNLPYNAGTAIVRYLLESEPRPRRLVVMLQKEVAESMLAGPGEMGLVGVGVQVYAVGRRLFEVAPGAFFPPPKVRSLVIELRALEEPLVPVGERPRFFQVVRAGFSTPRKQLRNSLVNGLGLSRQESEDAIRSAGLDPTARAQELSIDDWLRLERALDDAPA